MTLDELKRLFKKQIPAAYESLKEAEAMPEGEVKRYKISAAIEVIEKAQGILESYCTDLKFKDELILAHRVENVPRERTAMIFFDYVNTEPTRAIKNLKALEDLAYKKLLNLLNNQEICSEDLSNTTQQSMADRLKAREQRMKG
ncbi:hypothetical protein QH639_25255 [Lysinibacillus sp. 1 U-2021]|uniref:hypothetical protein n=1 Tax=Lysinibacillus sp. 1 U-2021 TaxID=3039426 RepID=UPI0024813319|nr:hypothetical protein [Lysinibacillus sp. 1 U-2021]WGT39048.1 hypothetical protein QH639_25255 [Lysinibacillus sp. 1 U-2021]